MRTLPRYFSVVLAGLFAATASVAFAQQMYTRRDSNGTVVFSNAPTTRGYDSYGAPPQAAAPDPAVVQADTIVADPPQFQTVALPGERATVTERVLPIASTRRAPLRLVASADNRRIAFVATRGDRAAVVSDGIAGPTYRAITALTMSPDGSRLAYGARQDDHNVIVVDGQAHPVDSPVSRLYFSPDSRSLAALALTSRGAVMLVNGRAHPVVANIFPDSVRFSPDGQHIIYGVSEGQAMRVVLDGVAGPSFSAIAFDTLSFGPDSRQISYVARNGNDWHMVTSDGPGIAYKGILPPGMIYDRTGMHRAFRAEQGSRQIVVVTDGVERGPYQGAYGVVYSPDGAHSSYGVWNSDGWQVLVDGIGGQTFNEIADQALHYSPDSRRTAFGARRDGRSLLVLDGDETPALGPISGPVIFSPDSRRVAYVASKEILRFVVLDGQAGAQYRSIEAVPQFSPDSAHLAYIASDQVHASVVLDEREDPPYERIDPSSLVFSADSKHLAYAARQSGRWRVVVDGVAGQQRFVALLGQPPLSFDGAGRLHYAGTTDQDGSVAWVEAAITGAGPRSEIAER